MASTLIISVVITSKLCSRDTRIFQKIQPEPRHAPHQALWAKHQPSRYLSSTAPSLETNTYIIHCDRFSRAQHDPGTLSSASTKIPTGHQFWAQPGRRSWNFAFLLCNIRIAVDSSVNRRLLGNLSSGRFCSESELKENLFIGVGHVVSCWAIALYKRSTKWLMTLLACITTGSVFWKS